MGWRLTSSLPPKLLRVATRAYGAALGQIPSSVGKVRRHFPQLAPYDCQRCQCCSFSSNRPLAWKAWPFPKFGRTQYKVTTPFYLEVWVWVTFNSHFISLRTMKRNKIMVKCQITQATSQGDISIVHGFPGEIFDAIKKNSTETFSFGTSKFFSVWWRIGRCQGWLNIILLGNWIELYYWGIWSCSCSVWLLIGEVVWLYGVVGS